MIRRALIIYCDDTKSGKLPGPVYDNQNFRNFLTSNLGGAWFDYEIESLENPTSFQIKKVINEFLYGADYTFIIFSGHGFIDIDDDYKQYLEVSDKDIPIFSLVSSARRQTLIVDACRGYWSDIQEGLKGLYDHLERFTGDVYTTRDIFDDAVMKAEKGWTILFAASEDETALDTTKGGAYLLSLLKTIEIWGKYDKKHNILDLKETHDYAINYLAENFNTIQVPTMTSEKRMRYFPFAVKFN